MNTYFDIEALAQSSDVDSAERKALLTAAVEGKLEAVPMVILFIEYLGAGQAKMAFPNGNEFITKPKTWRTMTKFFSHLQRGKAYHFLCVQEGKNKYPVCLIEEVLKGEKAYSATLSKMPPKDYLLLAVEKNLSCTH